MKTSESIKQLAPALLRAQRKIGGAIKGSSNPFFKSRYADLGAVMAACKEELNSEEITVLQPLGSDETGDYVETTFLHSSGEFATSRMKIPAYKNAQELGSNVSYLKRYLLQSMVFTPSEDDDAEASMGRGKPTSKAKDSWVPPSVTGPSPQELVSGSIPAVPHLTTEPKKSTFKKPAVVKEPVVDNGGWE